MMASCRHFIDEENKGIIVKIEKNRFDDYQYRIQIKNLDKCSLRCLMTYYTDTEYRIGDTVTLRVTPQQTNTNDTTKIN